MKEIDLKTWKRKTHFEFFSRMDYPHFNICFDISVTGLLAYTREHNLSFYYTMIYLATISANQVEQFRYRRRGDTVILHEEICPAFTDMSEGDDLFKMVSMNKCDNLRDFVLMAGEKSAKQADYFIVSDFIGRDDYIYITAIPWISFTHISHTISLNKDDSVPRISWGKYYNKGADVCLPFSVQVNHCFADGIHIGTYQDRLISNMKKVGGL